MSLTKDSKDSGEVIGRTLPNTKWDCITISINICTKINSCTCPSCWCSPTDMNMCDSAAKEDIALRRC